MGRGVEGSGVEWGGVKAPVLIGRFFIERKVMHTAVEPANRAHSIADWPRWRTCGSRAVATPIPHTYLAHIY